MTTRRPDSDEPVTDVEQARLLATWLDRPGEEPPDALDDVVVEALAALRPDLAPPPRVSADDILGLVSEGPLAPRAEAEVVPFPGAAAAAPAAAPPRRRYGRWAGSLLLLAAATLLAVKLQAPRWEPSTPPVPGSTSRLDAPPAPTPDPAIVTEAPSAEPTDVLGQEAAPPADALRKEEEAPVEEGWFSGGRQAAATDDAFKPADLPIGRSPAPVVPVAQAPLAQLDAGQVATREVADGLGPFATATPMAPVEAPPPPPPDPARAAKKDAAPRPAETAATAPAGDAAGYASGGASLDEEVRSAPEDAPMEAQSARRDRIVLFDPPRKQPTRAKASPGGAASNLEYELLGDDVSLAGPERAEAEAEEDVADETTVSATVASEEKAKVEKPSATDDARADAALRARAIPTDRRSLGEPGLAQAIASVEAHVSRRAWADASREARVALDAEPANTADRSHLLVLLGDALAAQGDPAGARAAWREAAALNAARRATYTAPASVEEH